MTLVGYIERRNSRPRLSTGWDGADATEPLRVIFAQDRVLTEILCKFSFVV